MSGQVIQVDFGVKAREAPSFTAQETLSLCRFFTRGKMAGAFAGDTALPSYPPGKGACISFELNLGTRNTLISLRKETDGNGVLRYFYDAYKGKSASFTDFEEALEHLRGEMPRYVEEAFKIMRIRALANLSGPACLF